MSGEFNETLNLILKTTQDNYNHLTESINDIKKNITDHIEKSTGALTDIQLLKLKVEIIEKDFLELKINNSDQHKEFYKNFKALDKIVFKIVGAMSAGGVIAGFAIKLINKG